MRKYHYSIIFAVLIILLSIWNDGVIVIENKRELGEALFFEKMLSRDSSLACASCHKPEFAFADTVAFSMGIAGNVGERNAPSVMNMLDRPYYFYDGRAASLEEQALVPIQHPLEMGLAYDVVVKRLQESTFYINAFNNVYGSLPDSTNILEALAAFQMDLESDGSAPHDRWITEDDETAMSPAQMRGREIFIGKGKCFDCHFGPDFTGDEFKNIGLYDGVNLTDRGRFEISQDSTDLGSFKVAGLRNVALTPPYMHNGMFATLEEVVEFYDDPYQFVENPINIDSLVREPLHLTAQEKSDLVSFMHALTDEQLPKFEAFQEK